jgi:chaperonin cofactor prefoldin
MVSEDHDFQKRKEELEERLSTLESERVSLIEEVQSLRQRRTLKDLDKKANLLQDTVDVLKREKEDLQGQISSLDDDR